ncbi:peptidylprolyl isomerase [Planktotalea sp.]|uniref:peptidylprolyl isomerase n=1 Tax=Planktotalea sp. TaxID=2029877 RepID=UPI0032984258
MLKRTQFLASAALALTLALPAQAENDAETVVATVNGVEITLGHMIVAQSALPDQYRNLPADVLFNGLLDQLVQQTILAEELKEVPARVQTALENERRALLAAEHMDGVLKDAVTDEAVQAVYDATYAGAADNPEMEFDASHILVETEEEANALVKTLEGGADFAELAKEKSTGPSGPRGGALGWFGKGQMVPEFENAVVDMEVGAVSAPIKTQFGWHVIKLNDSRAKEAPKLEDVRAEMEQQVRMNVVDDYISKLTAGATISKKTTEDIDPSLLKDLSLLEN